MRGRKPSPTATLRLRGSQRAKGRSEPEVPAVADVPAPPSWLSAMAKGKWKELAPTLVQAGILTNLDMDRLADYSIAFARWRKAEAKLVVPA